MEPLDPERVRGLFGKDFDSAHDFLQLGAASAGALVSRLKPKPGGTSHNLESILSELKASCENVGAQELAELSARTAETVRAGGVAELSADDLTQFREALDRFMTAVETYVG